jgi:hypothetical protein
MNQELLGRDGGSQNRFRIFRLHLFSGEFLDNGWDRTRQLLDPRTQFFSTSSLLTKLKRPIPMKGQVAELAADILAKVAFDMQRNILAAEFVTPGSVPLSASSFGKLSICRTNLARSRRNSDARLLARTINARPLSPRPSADAS